VPVFIPKPCYAPCFTAMLKVIAVPGACKNNVRRNSFIYI
jgi:hypothetical protein